MFYLAILRVEYEQKCNDHDGLYFMIRFKSIISIIFSIFRTTMENTIIVLLIDVKRKLKMLQCPTQSTIPDSDNNEFQFSLSKIRNITTIDDGVYNAYILFPTVF